MTLKERKKRSDKTLKEYMESLIHRKAPRELEIVKSSASLDEQDAWMKNSQYGLQLWIKKTPSGDYLVMEVKSDSIPDLLGQFMNQVFRLDQFSQYKELGLLMNTNPMSDESKEILKGASMVKGLGWTQEEVYAWFGEVVPTLEAAEEPVTNSLVRRRP